jgi:microcompartment protein CcmL/EutN
MIEPALALIEYSSIASGMQAADAVIKKAQIRLEGQDDSTGVPGAAGGEVGDVEESLAAGRQVGGEAVLDFVFLPVVHPEVVESVTGLRRPEPIDALGVIETTCVASTILAADAGVKGAEVHLVEIRLGDGLGGKGIVLYSGLVADVEAAVSIGVGVLRRPDVLVRQVVIPQLHPEMWANVSDSTRFRQRVTEADEMDGSSARSSPPARPRASRASSSSSCRCWMSSAGRAASRRSPPTPPLRPGRGNW